MYTALHVFPFFTDLKERIDEKTWLALGLSTQAVTIEARKPVFLYKEMPNAVYCILEGEIEVVLDWLPPNPTIFEIKEESVATLTAGRVFGEVGLLYGKRRTASCIASSDTLCLKITKEIFDELIAWQTK